MQESLAAGDWDMPAIKKVENDEQIPLGMRNAPDGELYEDVSEKNALVLLQS